MDFNLSHNTGEKDCIYTRVQCVSTECSYFCIADNNCAFKTLVLRKGTCRYYKTGTHEDRKDIADNYLDWAYEVPEKQNK